MEKVPSFIPTTHTPKAISLLPHELARCYSLLSQMPRDPSIIWMSDFKMPRASSYVNCSASLIAEPNQATNLEPVSRTTEQETKNAPHAGSWEGTPKLPQRVRLDTTARVVGHRQTTPLRPITAPHVPVFFHHTLMF